MAACSGKSTHPPIKVDLVQIFTHVGGDLPTCLKMLLFGLLGLHCNFMN